MKILVINAGSSSLKYQLFDMTSQEVLAKGLCERIGLDGHLEHKIVRNLEVVDRNIPMPTHKEAIEAVMEILVDERYGVINSVKEISAVGHRVLHGGDKFVASCRVDEACKQAIRDCIPLGPLHNPANLMGIEACEKAMPGVPQVAVFDTAFHSTMPPKAFTYAVPYEYYEKYRVRRYGFHGTSHLYVSGKAAELLDKPVEETRIVTCHLGNGSSIAAVKGGKCVDTSMGLTPLDGIPMGTRSGSIDPAILEFICYHENLNINQMLTVLNKKSGVLGISGVSNDFRDLRKAAGEGNERAILALEMFTYAVKKYIGAYAAAMGGLDAVVFTAGVGENVPSVRKSITDGLDFLGLTIDDDKNNERGTVDITGADSKVKVFVIPTNEELVIAQDTVRICGLK